MPEREQRLRALIEFHRAAMDIAERIMRGDVVTPAEMLRLREAAQQAGKLPAEAREAVMDSLNTGRPEAYSWYLATEYAWTAALCREAMQRPEVAAELLG